MPRLYKITTILIQQAANKKPIIILMQKLVINKNTTLNIHINNLSFNIFINILGQDINFNPKSKTLYYYISNKIARGQIQPINKEKQHSIVEDIFLQKIDRFLFIIKQRNIGRLLPKANLVLLTYFYSLYCQLRIMQSLTLYFCTFAFIK